MFAAATASAEAKVFRGKTKQGRPASVVIGTDGLLRTARVNWRGHCRTNGRVRDKTAFTRPHDQSSPGAFFDAGTYRSRTTDGYGLRFTVSIRGTRIAGRGRRALARDVPREGPGDQARPLRGHVPQRPPAVHAARGLRTAM